MQLTNFEEFIDDTILTRGKTYFQKGKVEEVFMDDEGEFSAIVSGSEEYQVHVTLGDNGEIVKSYCECPYDFGEYCKHEVAVFYTLSSNKLPKTKQIAKGKKESLPDILKALKKEELVEIILGIAKDDRHLEKQLFMKYGTTEDEVKASKKLIKEYISSAKVRGFIEWNRTGHAVRGAYLVLEKAESLIESNPKMAVLLGLCSLSEMVDLIQYCDDSSGDVGNVISVSLDLIKDATAKGKVLAPTDQKELFQTILKEARHNRYDGWSEWENSLLEACIPLCEDLTLRKILEDELQTKIQQIKGDSWSENYTKQKLMLLQLEIMEQFYPEKVNEFLFKNVHLDKFREMAIMKLFEDKDYELIIDLCFDGEQVDAKYRGTVNKWRRYRYQAYECLGDIQKQRELAQALLLIGDFNYFHKLKELYPIAEWNDVLNDVLIIFEETGHSDTYVKILIEEKYSGKLLHYCRDNVHKIEQLYPHLIEEYPAEVARLFADYIRRDSAASSNRSNYKRVCQVIKTFKKVSGTEPATQLIQELQQSYGRRPAFIDELRKIM